MLVRFIKHAPTERTDSVMCVNPDGSNTTCPMARQGVLPHEALHFVVEKTLGWHDAFFGQVARSGNLESVTLKLHDLDIDRAKNTQAVQSEALVECLQAEQANAPADPAGFALNLLASCRRRGVPPPDIDANELVRVRVALREFGAAWRPLAPGAALERTF